MKTTFRYLITIILFSFFLNMTFAQELSTSEILGNDNPAETTELDQKEEEREDSFLNQLLLDIPVLTDNPSHIITFVDPSEEKSGIQLEIDAKSFQDISSPYPLPALSIGQHALRFKFVDKYGSTQILEKDIVIIPRPPIINSPTFDNTLLTISGTGLSNSELILILSSSRNIITREVDIDGEGDWKIEISNEDLSEGIYTFTAYTRRYGYASNLAEPVTFEVGDSQTISVNNGSDNGINFKFKDISFSNISSVISDNSDLMILVIIVFVVGFGLSALLFFVFKDRTEEKKVKSLEKRITENGKKGKEMTLKEKLSKSDKKEIPIEKKKEEETKQEKIVTKIDFLKDFKMFDPDDEKGKEKDNIKVTLTSKD